MSDHKDLYLVCKNKCLVKYSVDLVYPVGSIYISKNETSPASIFGGTWERIKDRFLLAAGDTYAAGDSGGEAEHTLTETEMPAHYHSFQEIKSDQENYDVFIAPAVSGQSGYKWNMTGATAYTGYNGGSKAHNNMPPYLAVYVWRRSA